MISRRRTREFLLQSLYSRSELGKDFDRESFISSYFEDEGMMDQIDIPYVDTLEKIILHDEIKLITMISKLAPKFELQTIPVIHILILMIAISEIISSPSLGIPDAVSVNEAIELAKKFSDDHGKAFINGTLSTFLKEKDAIIVPSLEKNNFRVFQ